MKLFLKPEFMFMAMQRLGQNYKIFSSIIGFYAIDMMNHLIWFQPSIKHFFCNKAMFINIAIRKCIRMIWLANPDITPNCFNLSPNPRMMIFTRIRFTKFQTFISFFKSFSLNFIKTFRRTISLIFMIGIPKRAFANWTNGGFNHNYIIH